MFKKIDAIANEPHVDDILNRCIFTSDHRIEQHRLLQDFINALLRVENQYIDPVIQLRAQELAREMGKLLTLFRQTFSLVPGGRLKFYPELIDSDRYDEDRTELTEKLEKAWDAYKTYRLAVRDRLMV